MAMRLLCANRILFPAPSFLLILLFSIIILGCASQSQPPHPGPRPVEFEPILDCGKIVKVFFDDSEFLAGYTLQESEGDFLPDVHVWTSEKGLMPSSQRGGESRQLTYKKDRLVDLQLRLTKILGVNAQAGNVREVTIKLTNIVIETLANPRVTTPDLPMSVRKKPYVRTLVRADEIEITAITDSGIQADIELYNSLLPGLTINEDDGKQKVTDQESKKDGTVAKLSGRWKDNTKSVSVGKRVYFELCTDHPKNHMATVVDLSKNRLSVAAPLWRDSFFLRNLLAEEVNWRCEEVPTTLKPPIPNQGIVRATLQNGPSFSDHITVDVLQWPIRRTEYVLQIYAWGKDKGKDEIKYIIVETEPINIGQPDPRSGSFLDVGLPKGKE